MAIQWTSSNPDVSTVKVTVGGVTLSIPGVNTKNNAANPGKGWFVAMFHRHFYGFSEEDAYETCKITRTITEEGMNAGI